MRTVIVVRPRWTRGAEMEAGGAGVEAERERRERADHAAVHEDGDRDVVRVVVEQPLDGARDAHLQLVVRLAVGPARAARGVAVRALGVALADAAAVEARPRADVDLAEVLALLHRQAEQRGERRGGLAGARQVGGHDGVDAQPRELGRGALRLGDGRWR